MDRFKEFPELEKVFRKMFEMVGANIENFDFNNEEWFKEYSWTEEQEAEFKEWLMDMIKNNKNLQYELYNGRVSNKKIIEGLADEFLLMWGWSYEKG